MKDKDKLDKINETAFNMIDFNNNGKIERDELELILSMTA
jgi:Ca2+-binding EF-hand superfamily protein